MTFKEEFLIMVKIATLITYLYEDVEFTEPAKTFEDEGHELVTIEKKQAMRLKVNKVEN